MTPCVKRYYFLYFSHPHPPVFRRPRPFCHTRKHYLQGLHLVYVFRLEAASLQHGTAWHGPNRHILSCHCKADKHKGEGKSKCRGMELFQVHHRVHKNHRGASSVVFLFCFCFFSRAFVNYSPFPALSSRPHVRCRKRLGERKLAVPWV